MHRLVLISIAAVTMAIAIGLFPFDSDAAFAAYDPIFYGLGAEDAPRMSINGHHPLFHVLVWTLVEPLLKLGIAAPGHVACRIVAGLGAAWLLLQISALCGRRLVGAGLAILILCTRGFVVELAVGENVLPAAAAALYALTLASRPVPGLASTCAACVVALVLRQDNVLILPGVLGALASGAAPGRRARVVAIAIGATGGVTAAGYVIAWMAHGETPFLTWLLGFGMGDASPERFSSESFRLYAESITLAMTGRLATPLANAPAAGLAYGVAILGCGALFRGTTPRVRLALALAATLVLRALFHAWFEPRNFEWLVPSLALAAALASALAHGEPATSPFWRKMGAALILGLAAWILAAHGPATWRLREPSLRSAIEAAVAVDPRARIIAANGRVDLGLALLRISHVTISDRQLEERLAEELARHPVPTVVISDRFVGDGMTLPTPSAAPLPIDGMEDPPGWRIIRRDGVAYAALWTASGVESRTGPR